MKSVIFEKLDLENGHYTDYEVEKMYDMVNNPQNYEGRSTVITNSFDDWCSDGRYHRDEETIYILHSDENGIRIDERYQYKDDDGQHGESTNTYDNGREFINKFFDLFN